MQGAADLAGDPLLKVSRRSFTPRGLRREPQTAHDTPDVGVDRTSVAAEGVQHHAPSGLSSHTGKARQVRLGFVIRKVTKVAQVQPPLSLLDLPEDRLNLVRLGSCEARVVEEVLEHLRVSVSYERPGRHRIAQLIVGSEVLDLLGHSGQDEEYEVVERVDGVVVRRSAVRSVQASFNPPNLEVSSRSTTSSSTQSRPSSPRWMMAQAASRPGDA